MTMLAVAVWLAAAWGATASAGPPGTVMRGVPYATVSPLQTLDLYLPDADGAAPAPLVILIHGGAFRRGSSAQMAPIATTLVRRGYAVAAVNYRLAPAARYPTGARDVKAAVRWLRVHASDHGIDPWRFAAWGRSAGGWMATMLGATGGRATIFDDPSLGNPTVSSEVQAVVDWYGPVDLSSMEGQLARMPRCRARWPGPHSRSHLAISRWLGRDPSRSPLTATTNLTGYLARSATLPPWFIVHGTADCTVPEAQSRQLRRALLLTAGEVGYLPLRGVGHGAAGFTDLLTRRSIAFIRRSLGT